MNSGRYRFLSLAAVLLGLALFPSASQAQKTEDGPKEKEIAKLFDKWNATLQTGKAEEVVKLYAPNAVLLPTVSNKVRYSQAEIQDYFEHFLKMKPNGKINEQTIRI